MKNFPYHTLLFSIAPIIFLFANNIQQVQSMNIILPLLINISIGLISILLVYAITKKWLQAGFEASIILILFTTYGHVFTLMIYKGYFLQDQSPIYISYIIIFVILTWINFKGIKNFKKISEFLNVVSAGLLLASCFSIAQNLIRRNYNLPNPPISTTYEKPDYLPDIYYLVLDGYGGMEMLNHIYGYNNQPFISFLEEKGFYVANDSKANYVRTIQSLSSTLNLNYFNADNWMHETISDESAWFFGLIYNNFVKNQLEYLGYKIYIIPNQFKTSDWKHANLVDKTSLGTPFLWEYMRTTMFIQFWTNLPYKIHKAQVLNNFDQVVKSVGIEGPKFLFAHILVPHPPFVFDKFGNDNFSNRFFTIYDGSDLGLNVEVYQSKYIEQLQYTNFLLEEMISEMIKNSESEPIIIIQGDHGPGSYLDYYHYENNNCFYERYSILNAYFFPDKNYSNLYPEISPINSFRLIFDQYYGLSYDFLDDRSFYSTSDEMINFTEVTEFLTPDFCNLSLK